MSSPTVELKDNQETIIVSKNKTRHSTTKHIDITYHFARETVGRKQVVLNYCSSEKMAADIRTKGLPKQTSEQ